MNLTTFLIIFFILFSACKKQAPNPSLIDDLNKKLQDLNKKPHLNADSTLSWLSEAYQVYEDYTNLEGMAQCKFMMGNIFLEIGSYSQALDNLKDAALWFGETGNKNALADVNISLSLIYINSSDFLMAKQFAEEAIQLYKSTGNQSGLAEAYGALGHFFEKTETYQQALHYQKMALTIYEKTKDTVGLAIIHDNMGSIYEDLSNFSQAQYHFEIAYQYNHQKNNLTGTVINLNNLGDVHRKQGNLFLALEYTTKSYQLSLQLENNLQRRSAMRDLAKVYHDQGQVDSAYYYLEQSYELTGRIFGKQTAEEVGKMKTLFEVARKEEHIAMLQTEQKQGRLILSIIITASVVLLLFAFSLGYQIFQKSKKERKIMEMQSELTRTELENTRLNEQNLIRELENKKLMENQLSQRLELKNKSITTSTLQLIQKNEFFEVIRKQLDDLKKTEDKKTKQQVKKIIRSIDLKYNLDEDWAEFEHVFEQVHDGFFEILQKVHPNLTSSEIRLCALIKLNLPSHNVATIMGISSNSLRIARYRLKKKLNLAKEKNLYSYLYNLE